MGDGGEADEHHLVDAGVDDLEQALLEHGAVEAGELAREDAELERVAEVAHGAVDPAQAVLVGQAHGVQRAAQALVAVLEGRRRRGPGGDLAGAEDDGVDEALELGVKGISVRRRSLR